MIDLDKVVFASPYNAYKNVNSYSGTITMPTTLAANTVLLTTQTITLSEAPVFTAFYAQFVDFLDDIFSNPNNTTPLTPVWYPINISTYEVGIYTTTSPFTGWLTTGIFPVINGNTVTVTAQLQNPSATPLTLSPLSIPFIFIEYTLAN